MTFLAEKAKNKSQTERVWTWRWYDFDNGIEYDIVLCNFYLDTVSSESAGGASTFDQVYSSHIVAVDANPNLGQSTTRGHTVSVCVKLIISTYGYSNT